MMVDTCHCLLTIAIRCCSNNVTLQQSSRIYPVVYVLSACVLFRSRVARNTWSVYSTLSLAALRLTPRQVAVSGDRVIYFYSPVVCTFCQVLSVNTRPFIWGLLFTSSASTLVVYKVDQRDCSHIGVQRLHIARLHKETDRYLSGDRPLFIPPLGTVLAFIFKGTFSDNFGKLDVLRFLQYVFFISRKSICWGIKSDEKVKCMCANCWLIFPGELCVTHCTMLSKHVISL